MKKTLILVIVLILSISFYNIWHINKNNAETVIEVFEKNHWIQFDQNASTEIKVTNFELLSEEELNQLVTDYNDDINNYRIENTQMKAVIVTIEKRNEELAKNSINQAMLVTGNFSNGLHLPLTMLLNERESETEKLVYLITDNLMSKKHWEGINHLDFSLVVSYSPKEIRIKLN